MKKEQLEILVQICTEENISLKEAIGKIPQLIKEYPGLSNTFGGIK